MNINLFELSRNGYIKEVNVRLKCVLLYYGITEDN